MNTFPGTTADNSKRYSLLYVALIAVICFLSAKLVPEYLAFLQHILFGVGEALVISLIVILLVEARAKEHFISQILKATNELKTDAFLGGFGFGLPEKYVSALKELIVTAKVTREKFHLSFTPNETIGPNGIEVTLHGKVRYLLVNNTSVDVKQSVSAKVDKSILQGLHVPEPLIRMHIEGVDIPAKELEKDESDPSQTKFSHEVNLPGKAQIIVEWEYAIKKLAVGNEPFITSLPSGGLVLTVEHPIQYVVGATAFHPSGLAHDAAKSSPTVAIWTINKPILPHQGICIFWTRKDLSF